MENVSDMQEAKVILGVGSRVKHPAYGEGAITRLHMAAYDVCFMQYGVKLVGKDYDKWEIIELGISTVGNDRRHIDSSLSNILAFVESLYLAEIVDSEIEILNL